MRLSSIDGSRQQPWLRAIRWILAALAIAGTTLSGEVGEALAGSAVIVVIAVPLLRVGWVTYRLAQERDRRFVMIGIAVLGAVAFGTLFPIVIG